MSIWKRIKRFFYRKSYLARDINLTLLAIKDELVILNNILQARVDNIPINTPNTLTNPEESVIIDKDTQESMYIPSPETELEADIRLEEKDTNSEALEDAVVRFRETKSTSKNGKSGGPSE